jgi:uncharacterized protein (DUF2225 family)
MLAAGTWAERRGNAERRLAMFLARQPHLVEGYLSMYGLRLTQERIAHIASLKGEGTKDPLFEVYLVCPVCECRDWVSYLYRSESQKLTQNDLLLPVMAEGLKGYATLCPTMYQIHVCPKCGYASTERDEFPTVRPESKPAQKPLRMPQAVTDLTQKDAEARLEILEGVDPRQLFARPRDLDALALACRMGIVSERHRVDAGLPRANYRTGGHHLRIAWVAAVYDEQEWEREELEAALASYEAEYAAEGSEEVLGPVCYLMMSICLRMDDESKARRYLDLLVQADRAQPGSVVKWLERTKLAYEDWRDRPQ